MREKTLRYARLAARLLEARSQQEREKRADLGFALLLVSGVAAVKHVTGLTLHDAPFTLYPLAIAASAARGGFAAGLVAALASIVIAGIVASPPLDARARLLFGTEGLLLALIVSVVRFHLQASEGRLAAAVARIAELKLRDRRYRLLDAALAHLEDTTRETAVVVLNQRGEIAEWRGGAERLYGYAAEDVVGKPGSALFTESPSPSEWSALLHRATETGLRRSDVHRRRDGAPVTVEMEIKPVGDADARGFTLAVHDTARRREWDEYREDATRAQEALHEAGEHTRRQLAALESLTDPSLNPFEGPAMVAELIDRLRVAVRADGAALVQPGRVGTGIVAARGLQPAAGPSGAESLRLAPGRVAVVHNDPVRIEQLSALRWPADVASLLAVPVVHDGQVWSTLEIVSQRSRQVSDWDVALARVVADRLATVVARGRGLAAKAS